MKFPIICSECSRINGGNAVYIEVIPKQEGLYQGDCPAGHRLLVGTQTLRHELLFDIALNALRDGYPREAVLSFMGSLERYYEFSVRVILRSHKVPEPIIDDVWSSLAKLSERQLGAYLTLFAIAFGREAQRLSNKHIEFRNRIVHQGELPNVKTAIDFGRSAYEIIQQGISALRNEYLDHVNAELNAHVARVSEGMGTEYPRAFMVTPTALNVIEDTSKGYKPFDEVLNRYLPKSVRP